MATFNTAQGLLDETINKSYDMDGMYGKQCWDYGDFFWLKQVSRELSTGGTGQARGCWTKLAARRANAGSDFDLITNKNDLQVGDWVIFNCGTYGHVGVVYSILDKGRKVVLQSQNQGIIRNKVTRVNMSLDTFLGAFRYKGWYNKRVDFLPERGYWKRGDNDPRVGRLCNFFAENFYGYYCRNKQEAHRLLDGNYFGPNCEKWVKEFQKRTNLKSDGCVGPITYDKLKQFGFRY